MDYKIDHKIDYKIDYKIRLVLYKRCFDRCSCQVATIDDYATHARTVKQFLGDKKNSWDNDPLPVTVGMCFVIISL